MQSDLQWADVSIKWKDVFGWMTLIIMRRHEFLAMNGKLAWARICESFKHFGWKKKEKWSVKKTLFGEY